jgi:uncharacterized protein YuzE
MTMKYEYDNDAGALYITVTDGIVARTEQLDPGVLLDVDEHGQVVGIEIIKPDRDWFSEDLKERLSPADQGAIEHAAGKRWGWNREAGLLAQ